MRWGWGVWYRISSVYFVWGSGVVNEMGVGCLVQDIVCLLCVGCGV